MGRRAQGVENAFEVGSQRIGMGFRVGARNCDEGGWSWGVWLDVLLGWWCCGVSYVVAERWDC